MHNPPLNQCIYCGAKPGDVAWVPKDKMTRALLLEDFGREHIVPEGLNGHEVLGKASCPKCESITSDFERVIMRDSAWALRSTIGHKSGVKLPDTAAFGYLPIYNVPAIFSGQVEHNPTFGLLPIQARREDLRQMKKKATEIRPSTFTLDKSAWFRFIAKIAHGLAVKRWGLGGFLPLLPPTILGEREDHWNYVGGCPEGLEGEGVHVIQSYGIHIHAFDQISKEGAEFALVKIRLFSNAKGLPTYQAVAGLLPGYDPLILHEMYARGFHVPAA